MINELMKYVRLSDVCRMTTLSKRQVCRLEAKGHFPKRIEISARIVVWDFMEVLVWMHNKKSDRNWRKDLYWAGMDALAQQIQSKAYADSGHRSSPHFAKRAQHAEGMKYGNRKEAV